MTPWTLPTVDHAAELSLLRSLASEWRRREEEVADDAAWLLARFPHEAVAK